jgi:RluA family pseudouridine synthase
MTLSEEVRPTTGPLERAPPPVYDVAVDSVNLTVGRDEDAMPLVDFLAGHLALSRTRARARLDARWVFVNDRRTWMARHRLRAGDRVEVRPGPAPAAEGEVRVLHRDEQVLVCDKPPGLLSVGTDSLEERLRRQLGRPPLVAVHRLDRDTSGCLLLAADAGVKAALVDAFRRREVEKTYRAIVSGRLAREQTRIARSLEGRSALTEVRVLGAVPRASYLAVRLATGRTHQIRKHLAGIRHPVLGDRQYFTAPLRDAQLREVPRQMLHAFAIAFAHPVTGERLRVKAPLPADFQATLRRLNLS